MAAAARQHQSGEIKSVPPGRSKVSADDDGYLATSLADWQQIYDCGARADAAECGFSEFRFALIRIFCHQIRPTERPLCYPQCHAASRYITHTQLYSPNWW